MSIATHVIECDVKHVPKPSASTDLAVFCLSLMGINYVEFITEANRLLKLNGCMIVAEVTSRFASIDNFIKIVEHIGFKLIQKVRSLYSRKILGLILISWSSRRPRAGMVVLIPSVTLLEAVLRERLSKKSATKY